MTTPSSAPARPLTVITCHANADYDALASMIGLTLLYPDSVLVFPGSMEAPLTHVFNEIASVLYPFKSLKELELADVERLVVADTRQASRLAHVQPLLDKGVEVHVWDHHPEEGQVLEASFSCVGTVGSTCTLICRELEARGLVPTCQHATFLGLGIYGDTGSFTFNSTCAEDYRAAAWLHGYQMDLQFIAELVRHTMTGTHVKILNALLESATRREAGPYSVVLADCASDDFLPDFSYIVQKFMEIEACDVLFALGSMDGKVQLVARSRVDAVDVGRICRQLGGGGHRFAASASIKEKSILSIKDEVFQALFMQVHPHRTAGDLMSTPAVGIEERQTLREAETIMNRYGLKAAPIFRNGSRVCVGLMECQTASKAIAHGLGEMPVRDYIQRKAFSVSPEAPLQRLMDIIVGGRQRLVPVVERGEVIGVVTRTDLINMFVEDPGRIPVPRTNAPRERDLAKLLQSKLPKAMFQRLQLAGELGDTMGVSVYAVGGFVRDIILNRPAVVYDDVDLVVEGDGIAFARALAERLGGRVREHQAFMTALIVYMDQDGREQRLDVATARLEYYESPAALPTVELSSIKMDLFRRDFTINAMAIRMNRRSFGHLVDFFGGQSDIQRKVIRVIHALSFVEDPTRMIRAARFEQRYGFHLSVQCEKLIRNALSLDLVDKLSGARVFHELRIICNEQHPGRCFERLEELRVLAAIHPALGLTQDRRGLFASLREVLDWYRLLYFDEKPDVVVLYIMALCSGLTADETRSVLDRLAVSDMWANQLLDLRESVRTLLPQVAHWKKYSGKVSALHALLMPLSLEGALYLMARAPSMEISRVISRFIYQWRQVKIDIGGADLKAMGLKEGPRYGEVLRLVQAAKLDGVAETREAQLVMARTLIDVAGDRAR